MLSEPDDHYGEAAAQVGQTGSSEGPAETGRHSCGEISHRGAASGGRQLIHVPGVGAACRASQALCMSLQTGWQTRVPSRLISSPFPCLPHLLAAQSSAREGRMYWGSNSSRNSPHTEAGVEEVDEDMAFAASAVCKERRGPWRRRWLPLLTDRPAGFHRAFGALVPLTNATTPTGDESLSPRASPRLCRWGPQHRR